MLNKPRSLPLNPHFAVLAPAGPSDINRIRQAAAHLEAAGARVTIAPNVEHRHRGYLAGTDDERVEELNRHLRSAEYDAFLFSRGGYGVMRILDRIDYAAIAENPRPIIGFSDITALHQAVALHARVATFHGPMLNLDFHAGLSQGREMWFWSALRGEAPMTYTFDSRDILTSGSAEGVLFGGCLSITAALIGTPYDYWVDDGIWFWEDVDESVYRIDRMLTHLRLSGRMKNIRGVVIGKLKGCGSEEEIDSLLLEFFGSSGIPTVRNFPFGHQGDNMLMPVGAHVRLDSSDNSFTITERLVQ